MERPLTDNLRADGQPLSLREYMGCGGYKALGDALRGLAPADVTKAVKDSRLRGRGGAGFPTGLKWSFIETGPGAPEPRYVVCNADEMEPGTFKDKVLLLGNPHLLIEGILLAGYAVQAQAGYIFLRGEYAEAGRRVQVAIEEAYENRYVGRNILRSDFSFDLHLHMSAGRYMCGEETGLLNALEGRRANPRGKPPYPASVGLWGKPTVVNNVETLCCVPHILRNGADAFLKLSKTSDGGTKLYGVSGKVKHPGIWELPMGTSLREIIEEHAGGMQEGLGLRAVIPGGASTEFVLEKDLDIPMDFDSLKQVKSRMGTGTVIVLDDQTCPVSMVWNLEQFFAQESCGWCTPCWAGLAWVAETLFAIEHGGGKPEDLDILDMHVNLLGPPGHTFCALAPGAIEPLESALRHFRDEFVRHIEQKHCPYMARQSAAGVE
ncbi:MAG: NADH-quinone oxidoreductase subunit NuoF [Candidatus Hydrogenedentes bacterium]|nr:NADH-quinone oxidoreductase subunit NuoF [Candidatus Hydrogenedentota bacterium]